MLGSPARWRWWYLAGRQPWGQEPCRLLARNTGRDEHEYVVDNQGAGSLGAPDSELVSLSWVADQGSEAEPAMAISTLLRWRGHIPQRLRVCGWSWRGWSGSAVDALPFAAKSVRAATGASTALTWRAVNRAVVPSLLWSLAVVPACESVTPSRALNTLAVAPRCGADVSRDGDQSSRSGLFCR